MKYRKKPVVIEAEKWDDENGKGFDGLTDHERYQQGGYRYRTARIEREKKEQ